jgi:origin recognition complex subunit 2
VLIKKEVVPKGTKGKKNYQTDFEHEMDHDEEMIEGGVVKD